VYERFKIGRFQLGFRLLHLLFAGLNVGFLLANLQLNLLRHFQLRLRAGKACLGAAQLGVGRIDALLRGRARINAALAAILRLGVGHVGLRLQHLGFGFVALGGILHLRKRQLGLRLVELGNRQPKLGLRLVALRGGVAAGRSSPARRPFFTRWLSLTRSSMT